MGLYRACPDLSVALMWLNATERSWTRNLAGIQKCEDDEIRSGFVIDAGQISLVEFLILLYGQT